MNRASIVVSLVSSTCILGAAAFLAAGPLDPPGSQVAPTFKTLAEVEPRIAINAVNTPGDADDVFIIAQPGSYYLTANVLGASGKSGIHVVTSGDVTIDLCGFRVIGGAGSRHGIHTSGGFSNGRLTIRNGAVSNWLLAGILTEASDRVTHVEGVNVHDNSGPGIAVGPNSLVSRCVARANGDRGISVEEASTVSDCVSQANDAAGFRVGESSTVPNCSAVLNIEAGFRTVGSGVTFTGCTSRTNGAAGFEAATSVFNACTAIENDGVGINAGADSSLMNCQAQDNEGTGIVAGEGSTLAHCAARANAAGFLLGSASTIAHCTSIRNASHGFQSNAVGSSFTACTARFNAGSGFLGTRSTYTACAARENSLVGFDAGGGSTITGCIAQANNTDGIRVADDSYVLNNVCEGNGTGPDANAAGIHATSSDNRIEGNNCVGNDRGIQVDAGGNVIIRNTVAGPGAYTITGTQTIGPIITASGTISSTNPWANFTF